MDKKKVFIKSSKIVSDYVIYKTVNIINSKYVNVFYNLIIFTSLDNFIRLLLLKIGIEPIIISVIIGLLF